MRHCKHTQWLGLAVRDGDVFLQGTDRLHTLVEDLPDPDEQNPSLLVFIGNKSKAMAIKELVRTFSPPPRYGHDPSCQSQQDDESNHQRSRTKLNGRRAHGEIHLHIHTSSAFSSRPVLLAEGDLPALEKPRSALAPEQCHEMASTQLNTATTLTESADKIYFRLLSPFTDVFCFFATDVGGFRPIVHHLALWLDFGRPSSLPKTTHPKILIVTEGKEGSEESALRIFKRMLTEETTIDPLEQFSNIHLISLLPRNGVSNKSRHRKLKECLLNFSDQVRAARINSRTLFSARHFAAFYDHAFDHLAAASVEPFDFIVTSRVDNVVPRDLQEHLVNFLKHVKDLRKLFGFAIPVIASSLLLDSYLPGTHLFSPRGVFQALYKDVCIQVCRTGVLAHDGSTHLILPSRFVKLLEDEFSEQFEGFVKLSVASSIMWHRATLSKFRLEWLTIYSDDTCFVCNRRRPQYRLPCRHIICGSCLRKFGHKIDAWDFGVPACFLCELDTVGFTIKERPPTATARLLSIDGGGIRGVIPLVFLQALEERIGYPVQGNFDFVFGTSSGGISALGMYEKGWSVEDCIDHFERLAKMAFRKDALSYFRWLIQFRSILISLITDGIYPARHLEAVLREVFGSNKTILDYSNAKAMGAMIGITVSSMKPEPFIFTNYNGVGDREDKTYEEYGILLGSVRVWEIARSTSAAPGIFTTKSIAGLGKFQDGGLNNNNPIKLALKEIEAQSPNDPSAKRSTLKVSLGTGKTISGDPEMYGSSSWWRDIWVFRLFRAFWSSMNGEEWTDAVHRRELMSHREELKNEERTRRGEYFRFNVEFSGREPRLDDISKMNELKSIAREKILHSSSKQLDHLARCLIAENFVFELDPDVDARKKNGHYPYIGYILCRLRKGTPAFEALLERLTRTSAKFLFRGRTLPGSIRDRSSLGKDGNFRRRVCFEVTTKQELFSIRLQESGSESCNISGSPFSIDWLIPAQGLNRAFDGKGKRKGTDEGGLSRKRQRI